MSGDVVRDAEALVHSTMGKWDASHDAFHALRVRKLALSLAAEENLPPDSVEIVELASLLHDIGDHKYSRDESGGDPVEKFLESHGVESSKRDKIMNIIKTMGFKDELAGVTSGEFMLEFGVVQDADRLDAIGRWKGTLRLSKRIQKGEVDYQSKSGTAWSHSYLNQKPWHPLSYPNQRRKWIAEQSHAEKQRRAQEVAREFAQEQEFFRQAAAISKKEKEKVEMMHAVSFMYVRPPGYNAESAKAAEIAEERKKLGMSSDQQDSVVNVAVTEGKEHSTVRDGVSEGKKKARSKDIFGRTLPTEEEFEILKNAPRLETGLPVRVKPFGVEIRNVRCVRCGTYGHQSGDRECPLKDAIMPNEESRLKRDDPLTTIMAHTASDEPLKWELKQQPGGISPPRGGFQLDDPNQQIIPEDIFDEYGGFLNGGADIPDLLTNFSKEKSKKSKSRKKKSKHKKSHRAVLESSSDDCCRNYSSRHSSIKHNAVGRKSLKRKHKERKQHHPVSSTSTSSESEQHRKRRKRRRSSSMLSSSNSE